MKGNCIDCIHVYVCRCNWRPENVSETKYLMKYQQNIEGNSSFRIRKCNIFVNSLACIFIDFVSMFNVLSVILSFIVPYTTAHRRRSRGGGGGRPPPPPRIFLGGSSPPPSIFESLKNIYSYMYICI